MSVALKLHRPRLIVGGAFLILVTAAAWLWPIGWALGALEAWIAPGCLFVGSLIWFSEQRESRWRGGRWFSPTSGWILWCRHHLCAICLLISVMPLIAAWMGFYMHWATMYSNFLGCIPWSDASSYYAGAAAFLDDGELNRWTSRRPMNTLFLAVRYVIGGERIEIALLSQCLLGGVAFFPFNSKSMECVWPCRGPVFLGIELWIF